MMEKQILYTTIDDYNLHSESMIVGGNEYCFAMRKKTVEYLKENSLHEDKTIKYPLYVSGGYALLLTNVEEIVEKLVRIKMKSSYSLQDLIDGITDECIDMNICTLEVNYAILNLVNKYLN